MMRKSAEDFITSSRNLHKPPPPPNKNSNEDSAENHKKAFRFHEQIIRDSSKPLDFSARDCKRKTSNRRSKIKFLFIQQKVYSRLLEILQQINHQQQFTQLHFPQSKTAFLLDYSRSIPNFWCILYISNTSAASS